MARGGRRTGTPGKSYSERTDLNQPVRVAPGGEYGSRQRLTAAQHAVPLPNAQAAPAASATPPAAAGPPALAGQNPFLRPTERPAEPVTAGIASGPGPGPEALTSVNPVNDDVRQTLQALYAQNPNNDLLRLLELHDQGY